MSDVAIKATDLTKKFGDFTAVDHISFEVNKGEIFGLLGPNGAGKSTAIWMLSKLSVPTEGPATVAGFDVRKEDGKVREHIGLVSEKMIMHDEPTLGLDPQSTAEIRELVRRINPFIAFPRGA